MPLHYKGIFSQMDNEVMQSVASGVYAYLSGKANNIPLHDDALHFGPQIEKVVTAADLRSFTSQDENMAKQVSDQMLEMFNQAKAEMVKTDKFAEERRLFETMQEAQQQNFKQTWEPASDLLKQQYKPNEIDTEFYDGQFATAINPGGNRSVLFETVKAHLADQWAERLQKKQLDFEKEILDRHTDAFKANLTQKLNKLKQVRNDLADLIPDLGTLYSLISQMEGFGMGGLGQGDGDGNGQGMQNPVNDTLRSGRGGNGYGGGKGNLKHNSFDILAQFAKLLKGSSVEKLAQMLGRQGKNEVEFEEETYIKTIYKPEFKADFAAKSDITGIRESDDIGNMLSSEKILLCDADMENIFYKKFSEKKLHTYEYRGRYLAHREEHQEDKRQKIKEEPKGPFIICVDTSGSMGGLPETVAKALTYAIVRITIKEKRKCYLINFSSGIETRDLSKLTNAVTGLADFLTLEFSGGTDVEPALDEALRMLQMSDYKKGDVLIISDFIIGALDEKTLRAIQTAQKNKTKFHSLVIGDSANMRAIAGFDDCWFYDNKGRGVIQKK